MPAKGQKCVHKRCFDLETFLDYSNMSDVWQCPLCLKPLPFQDVVVDAETQEWLARYPEEVVQVRFKPDGTCLPVYEKTEEERNAKRKRRANNRAGRVPGPKRHAQDNGMGGTRVVGDLSSTSLPSSSSSSSSQHNAEASSNVNASDDGAGGASIDDAICIE